MRHDLDRKSATIPTNWDREIGLSTREPIRESHFGAFLAIRRNQIPKEFNMPTNSTAKFTILRHQKHFGPYSSKQLRKLALTKRLMPDDFVCRVGSKKRSRVLDIPCLYALLRPCTTLKQDVSSKVISEVSNKENVRSNDKIALRTAIGVYGLWKSYKAEMCPSEPSINPTEGSPVFRTADLLRHGEFDLKTYEKEKMDV
jgi:hypothetical protein